MKIWPISLGEVTAALPLDVVCILIIGKVPKYISFTFLIRYKYLQPSSYSLFWPESEKKDRGAVLERLGVNPFLSSLSYGEFKGQLSAYALHRYPCNLNTNGIYSGHRNVSPHLWKRVYRNFRRPQFSNIHLIVWPLPILPSS